MLIFSLAYLHILLSLRLPSLSQTYLSEQEVTVEEVMEEIRTFAPFLVEARSTVRYASVRQAWSSVWESVTVSTRLDVIDGQDPPQDYLVSLLNKTAGLLHPPIVAPSQPKIFSVMADLHHFQQKGWHGEEAVVLHGGDGTTEAR